MKRSGVAPSSAVDGLTTAVDEALDLLREFTQASQARTMENQPPASLLDQCLSLCNEYQASPREPVRTIHHLACSGGTLISKCLAAMPNTQIVSEVDPLSTMQHKASVPRFAPTDMIQLVRQSTRGASAQLIVDLFLSNLELVHANAVRTGQRLVLRDHAHSHFCTGPGLPSRATLRAIVESRLPVASVVTVRNPVDSYLSLKRNGWVHFEPQTFDEYCRRYLAFLQAYEGVPVVKYEAFLETPQQVMQEICELLQLSFSEQFSDLFAVFRLTGDSGRKSDVIEVRPRLRVDPDMEQELSASTNYRQLQIKLEYE